MRFSDAYSRWQNQNELDRLVEQWTVTHTTYEVMEELQQAGIAAVPSFSSKDLCTDPHLKERGAWVEVQHSIIGKQIVAAPFCTKLLADLGTPSVEIDQLVAEKIIY